MKITLVQCPCFAIRNPPLGLAYLAAAMRNAGHELAILDFNIDLYPKYPEFWKDEFGRRWLASDFFMDKAELVSWVELFADKILATDPDVIGFSVHTTSVYMSRLVARRIKEKNSAKPIVFGGPECLREKPEFLLGDRSVDYIVQGEGEQTLLELLAALQNKSALDSCNGLIFMQDGALIKNAPRQPVDINSLPLPDFSLFERQRYLYSDVFAMVTSKGCIRKCSFCVDPWYLGKYRSRNPEIVIKEIEYLIEHYQVNAVMFHDSLINANLQILEAICDLILERKIKIEWHANAIIRPMSNRLLRKMRSCGCRSLTYGIESGSQKVVNLMRKGFKLKDASGLIRRTAQAGITVVVNWIVGYPGEEHKDLIESARFYLKHRRYIFGTGSICVMAIDFPSPISQEIDKIGIIMDHPPFHWRYSDNTFQERLHRFDSFSGFVRKVGELYETDNRECSLYRKFIVYLKGQQILSSFIEDLNNRR